MRVYETSSDPILIKLYSEAEAIDLFGDDNFKEYATEFPDDLTTRYFEAYKAFFDIQNELSKFIAKRNEGLK